MGYKYKGKHVSINPASPEAVGICDYTGFIFNLSDLVKQYEYVGNDLVWTGYYVGRPYLSKPNEQNKPPIVLADPYPVKDPRPPQGCTETFSNNTLPVISEITLPINQIGNISDGYIAPPNDERLELLNQGMAKASPKMRLNGGPPTWSETTETQAEIFNKLQNVSFTR